MGDSGEWGGAGGDGFVSPGDGAIAAGTSGNYGVSVLAGGADTGGADEKGSARVSGIGNSCAFPAPPRHGRTCSTAVRF